MTDTPTTAVDYDAELRRYDDVLRRACRVRADRPDVAAASAWVNGFTSTDESLAGLDPAAATRATRRLRDTLAAHRTDDGVWFDSRAWLVTGSNQ